MPYRTLSIQDAAEYLHITAANVESLVHDREIPFERQGARVIFRKKELDEWASQRILGMPLRRLESYHRSSTSRVAAVSAEPPVMVGTLLPPDFIEPAFLAKTRSAVIRDLAALAARTQLVNDPDDLLRSLQEREDLCSTALAGGFALLHPRYHAPYMFERSFLLLARTPHPIPFGALDGRETDLFFLVCCEDDRIHLHVLARLCMMCQHTALLADLRGCETAAAMHEAVRFAEAAVADHGRPSGG